MSSSSWQYLPSEEQVSVSDMQSEMRHDIVSKANKIEDIKERSKFITQEVARASQI